MFESKKFKKAAAKFRNFGSLAVTAADHYDIGGTPPERLLNNPGKTLGELMSEGEIAIWIKEKEELISKFSKMEPNSFSVRTALPIIQTELDLGREYLRYLGKL